MKEQALKKLRGEMAKETKNEYVQVIGNFLVQHLEVNPIDAEKFINEKKTITASLQEMAKEAKKKKQGNMAVLTDAEGFATVLKYFGVDASAVIPTAQAVVLQSAAVVAASQVNVEEEKPKNRFNASMDDFWD